MGYDIVSKDINITPSGFSFTGMELLTTSQLGTLYSFLLANGDPESYNSKYLEEVTSEASLGNGKIIGNFSNYEDDYIILKINIPTGTKVLDLSFNLIPFNNNGRSKQTFRIIPQAASSYDDLLNYHLLNNGSYKVQYLPKNNETSIIFVYKYWNSSSTNCEMSNLNITYGGLETGDNAFVLSGQPFVDNGFSNKNGTNIPFENDMLVDSDLVTPLVNGIYTNTYEIDTISGPLEFTRNIFVGYESLFDITSEQLYAKYIPHGYTATIVGTTYNGEDNVNLTLKTGDAFSGICYSNLTLTLNNGISNVYSTSVQILNPC